MPRSSLECTQAGVDIVQERERLVDQIVVVEQAAALLLRGIAGEDGIRHDQQRGAAIAADHGVAPIENVADAFLLRAQEADQARVFDRLGHDGLRGLPSSVQNISR